MSASERGCRGGVSLRERQVRLGCSVRGGAESEMGEEVGNVQDYSHTVCNNGKYGCENVRGWVGDVVCRTVTELVRRFLELEFEDE